MMSLWRTAQVPMSVLSGPRACHTTSTPRGHPDGVSVEEAYDGQSHCTGPNAQRSRALLAREYMRDLNRPDDRAVRQLASGGTPAKPARSGHCDSCDVMRAPVQRVPAVTVGLGGEG